MSILDSVIALFENPWFYVVLAAVGLLAWKSIHHFMKKVPVINKRNSFILVTVLLAAAFFGVFGMLGFASVAQSGSTTIVASQVTTSFATDAGGTITQSTSRKNVFDVRLTDAQANETTGYEEVSTGVIMLTRGGVLNAASCPVTAHVPADYLNQSGTDPTNLYHLLERDTLNVPEVWLNCGSSSSAATTSSPKQSTVLPFAEGVAIGYCGIQMDVDEEGHDAMKQYESLPVVVDMCGESYMFNIFRMD